MKAHQIEPPSQFKPVALVLETQEEVDKFRALIGHVGIIQALELPSGSYSVLDCYSVDYMKWNAKLKRITR